MQYAYCFSIGIMSFKKSTKPCLIRSGRSAAIRGLPWTALSFLAGWWGIPWGPIFTVQCITRNLRGGHDVTDEFVNALL